MHFLIDIEEMRRDLAAHDALNTRLVRLQRVMEKANDTEMALGSDVVVMALERYAFLKIAGKGEGLHGLRRTRASASRTTGRARWKRSRCRRRKRWSDCNEKAPHAARLFLRLSVWPFTAGSRRLVKATGQGIVVFCQYLPDCEKASEEAGLMTNCTIGTMYLQNAGFNVALLQSDIRAVARNGYALTRGNPKESK
ncbi:hypothetical protein [Lysobacter sp. CFH 32150]|uniref:hypothetical protein n=1 Tax=Lysobacter sp. CFH 32150 TaxID=2927128 RepID=UPI001FA71000|nr:hypothetical protein [Lysobacter sp. CFH 32150]MCI4568949.1 hypothetical protein [Lysobacter sp. CFH 32150]